MTTPRQSVTDSRPDETGGGAATSKSKSFQIELTIKQAEELKAIWREHGGDGGMMLMQPVLNWNVFDSKKCFCHGIVLSDESRREIFAVFKKAMQQSDKLTHGGPTNEH